jgi:hypothetical protein
MVKENGETIEVAEEVDDDREDPDEDFEDEGWSFRKKFFSVIIVIIIIIAAMAALVLLNTDVQQVIVQKPERNTDGTGIIVQAYTSLEGSGHANGDGSIKILFEGDEKYNSKISFNDDYGRKEILYKDFIWDQGEYEIIVTFKDKSHSATFTPDIDMDFGIAEYLNVTLQLEPNEYELKTDPSERDNPIYLYVNAFVKEIVTENGVEKEQNPRAPPKGVTIDLTIAHENGISEKYSKQLDGVAFATFHEFIYWSSGSGPGPGNYFVSAVLTNNNVMVESPKYQIDLPNLKSQFINIAPIADVVDDNITKEGAFGQTTMEIFFDASNSWNEGEITKYIWDFDYETDFDPDEETTSPTISHTYTKNIISDKYTILLQIVGDVKDPKIVTDDGSNDGLETSILKQITLTINWRAF